MNKPEASFGAEQLCRDLQQYSSKNEIKTLSNHSSTRQRVFSDDYRCGGCVCGRTSQPKSSGTFAPNKA